MRALLNLTAAHKPMGFLMRIFNYILAFAFVASSSQIAFSALGCSWEGQTVPVGTEECVAGNHDNTKIQKCENVGGKAQWVALGTPCTCNTPAVEEDKHYYCLSGFTTGSSSAEQGGANSNAQQISTQSTAPDSRERKK